MRPCCPGTTTKRLPGIVVCRVRNWYQGSPVYLTRITDSLAVLTIPPYCPEDLNMAVADLPTYGYRRVGAAATGVRAGIACVKGLMRSGCIAL